jgi:hypothetical protein
LFFQYQTVADMAMALETQATAEGTPLLEAEQGLVTGHVPLLPIQYDELREPNPHRSARGYIYVIKKGHVTPDLVEEAWRHLMMHHDALRLRFTHEESGWRQYIIPPNDTVPVSLIDIDLPNMKRREEIGRVAAELCRNLHLSNGPIFRVALFGYGQAETNCLSIAIHHQVIEAMSIWVLMEDFLTVYTQLSQEKPVQLPAKTLSFKRAAELWEEYFNSPAVREELACWLEEMRQARESVPPIPLDYPDGVSLRPVWRRSVRALSAEETDILRRKVTAAYEARLIDALLACFSEAWWRWTGSRKLLFDQVGHARDIPSVEVDLSRTVGYLTHHTAVFLDLDVASNPVEALPLIKEQHQSVHPGFGHLLVQYLERDTELAERILPHSDLAFNYVVGFDQSPAPTEGPDGPEGFVEFQIGNQSVRETYREMLFAGVVVVNGQELHIGCSYNTNLHQESTIERLMQDWIDELWLMIDAHDEWKWLPDKFRQVLRLVIGFAPSPFDHWSRQLLRRLGKYCRAKPH